MSKRSLHANPERAAALGSKHGRRMTTRSRTDVLDLPHRPLKSSGEVCEFLEETINRVFQGLLDVRVANTLGFLAGIHLKALAQRAEAPETTNGEASPGIYMSLFERLRLSGAPQESAPQERVYELFPQPPQEDAGLASGPLPAPGESIDAPPTRPNTHPRVITVEVG
jgi:hypothetical protein